MHVDPRLIYEYLRYKDLSHIHALGILANIQGESDFVVQAQERSPLAGRGGFGLFQHTGSRRRALEAYCGDALGDWRTQVDFALSEPESKTYAHTELENAKQATEWWVRHWERPANIPAAIKTRTAYLPALERLVSHMTEHEPT